MSTITLEHVTKRFRQNLDGERKFVNAVNNVSMKIHDGEVLSIVGPSGCGKSTLLRLIAGLETPDSGQVYYDNVPLTEIDMKDRGIGMVFQNGALMPHWEGWQTVGFFLRLRQREQEVPERVARVAQVTGIGLERLLERKPSKLSGGERQRVGIARALARDPRVFLFDEPFANLDAKLRGQARVELKRLLYEFPVTSVYVTHDQIEAIALGDRLAVMRDGQLEQVGSYMQLYTQPVNLFVATFVGTPLMNIFKGEAENGHWIGRNFRDYPIRGDLSAGTWVSMGVRPENIRLVDEGVPAIVDHVMPYYGERYKLLDVHNHGEGWQITVPMETDIHAGETIHCALDEEAMLFFDTRSGVRIG